MNEEDKKAALEELMKDIRIEEEVVEPKAPESKPKTPSVQSPAPRPDPTSTVSGERTTSVS